MTKPKSHRLVRLADLTDRHHGRTVTVRDHTGRLDGLIPVGGSIQLVLCIGGARVFTEALPAGEYVEVHAKEGL